MTLSLPARAKALRERLTVLDRLGANVAEAGLLEDLRAELSQPVSELSRVLAQQTLLTSHGIKVAEPAALNSMRTRAASLRDKFLADKKASSLKKGAGWSNLLNEIKGALVDVGTGTTGAWKGYRQTVFTGDSPAVIKGRIAFTQANNSAFKEYERLSGLLRNEFDRLPVDSSGIERVRQIASELTKVAKSFDFDVPTDVKLFLEAIQAGGAPLDLMTETVTTWLKKNNALSSYRILPASR